MSDDPAAPRRIVAIVPVGELEGAKTRLGGTLDAEERLDLAETLLRRTLAATLASPDLAETLVISPDRRALTLATSVGARTLRQRTRGLNAGLREARADAIAGGADAILIIPIDLPRIDVGAIHAIVEPLTGSPVVVVAIDRHGLGTNALGLRPPDVIDVAFGRDSRRRHRDLALAANARHVELDGPLALDLDTPDDLVIAEQALAGLADGR